MELFQYTASNKIKWHCYQTNLMLVLVYSFTRWHTKGII